MRNRGNMFFYAMIFTAMVVVLIATGAGALLWQFGSSVAQTLAAFVVSLLPK